MNALSPDPGAPRRVLVTGGGGFIGRYVLPWLVAAGYEVHATTWRHANTYSGGVRWHQVDLLDRDAVSILCAEVRADWLLHLAWVTTPGAYVRDPANLEWTAASLWLVRRFVEHGGERMVGTGTCFEYDHHESGALHETRSPRKPSTLYGTCKAATGDVVSRFADEVGISNAWGRVFFLYGPHEHPGRLVASVVRALLANRDADVTHGRQVRDFLHVQDVAEALCTLLESEVTGPVNIGSGVASSLRDVVLTIGANLDRTEHIRLGARPTAADEPRTIVADIARLRDEVGFTPNWTLETGLNDTIAWWRRQVAADPHDRSHRP